MRSLSQELRWVYIIFLQYMHSIRDPISLPLHQITWFLFPTQEVDEFFEQEKMFLLDYFSKIKDSTAKAEKMTRSHKSMSFTIPY